jgi:hypothetical protein
MRPSPAPGRLPRSPAKQTGMAISATVTSSATGLPRSPSGRTRRTWPSGEAITLRNATTLTSAASTGTARTTATKANHAPGGGMWSYPERNAAKTTALPADPARHVNADSSAQMRRTCAGDAPASRSPAIRRSRWTAPMRAHWPRKPSTGTSRSSSVTTTPMRWPG